MAQNTPQVATKTTTMTINLRKKLIRLHATRRRKRAAGLVMEAVARFSKADPDGIRLSKELNEFIQKNASGASFLWSKLKLNVEKTGEKTEVKIYTAKAAAQPAPTAAKAVKAIAKPEEKKQEMKEKKETKEPKAQKQA